MGDSCDNLIRNGCLPQQSPASQESEITSLKLFKSVAVPINEHRKGLRGETLLISDFGSQAGKKSRIGVKFPVFCFGFVIGIIVAIIFFTLATYLLYGHGNVSFNFNENLPDGALKDKVDKGRTAGGIFRDHEKDLETKQDGKHENLLEKWSLTSVRPNTKEYGHSTTGQETARTKNLSESGVYLTTSSEGVQRASEIGNSLREINNSLDNNLADNRHSKDASDERRENSTETTANETPLVPKELPLPVSNETARDVLESSTNSSFEFLTKNFLPHLTTFHSSQSTFTQNFSFQTSTLSTLSESATSNRAPAEDAKSSESDFKVETTSNNYYMMPPNRTEFWTTLSPSGSSVEPLDPSPSTEMPSVLATAVENSTDAMTNKTTTVPHEETKPSAVLTNVTESAPTLASTVSIPTSTPIVVDNRTNVVEVTSVSSTSVFAGESNSSYAVTPVKTLNESVLNATEAPTIEKTNDTLTPTNSSDAIANKTSPSKPFEEDIHSNVTDPNSHTLLNGTMSSNRTIDFNQSVPQPGHKEIPKSNLTHTCPEKQFACASGSVLCLEDRHRCDGIPNCSDQSDEQNCTGTCGINFNCGNSSFVQCIPREVYCDGLWDCENGSDEGECHLTSCNANEVMCKDKSSCLIPYKICDGIYNCKDHSDEQGCIDTTGCKASGRFMCSSNLCIDSSLRCDGAKDCSDGRDELNCTCASSTFQCQNGECLGEGLRCNGMPDCRDGSDEWSCERVDTNGVIQIINPSTLEWSPLCYSENFTKERADAMCNKWSFAASFNYSSLAIALANETQWAASQYDSYVFTNSCSHNLAQIVVCQEYECSLKMDSVSKTGSTTERQTLVKIKSENTSTSEKECLAEIISPVWLLTSAECLSFDEDILSVWSNHTSKVSYVKETIKHPHSSKFRSFLFRDYDLALVRLKTPVDFKETNMNAMCLPDHDVDVEITCFASKFDDPDQTAFTVRDSSVCNDVQHYNGSLSPRQICAFRSRKNSDELPEGSPLICLSTKSKWFVAGVLSYESNRKSFVRHPSVFSSVYSMKGFVNAATGMHQHRVPYDGKVYTFPIESEVEILANTTDGRARSLNLSVPATYQQVNTTNTSAENVTESSTTSAIMSSPLDNTTFDGNMHDGNHSMQTVANDMNTTNATTEFSSSTALTKGITDHPLSAMTTIAAASETTALNIDTTTSEANYNNMTEVTEMSLEEDTKSVVQP